MIINDVTVNCRTPRARARARARARGSALMMEVCRLSAYANSLSEEAKKRYKDKISMIGGLDPYLGSLGECADTTPPVEASDLVSYLVLQTSFLTAEQFKAHKGLESYNQFVSGWVKEVKTWKRGEKFLTTGHVSLSLMTQL